MRIEGKVRDIHEKYHEVMVKRRKPPKLIANGHHRH